MPHAYTPARIMRAPVDNASLIKAVTAQCRDVAAVTSWPLGVPDRVGAKLCAYVEDALRYVEDGRLQSIRRPAALVLGGLSGDCKSTAVFIGGLAAAAGRSVVLRFVRYADGPAWFSHVYAVVDGVACDPLQGYGVELDYISALDQHISLTGSATKI